MNRWLVLIALVLAACAEKTEQQPAPSVTHTAEPSDAYDEGGFATRGSTAAGSAVLIDSKLMLALSQAKNFHHKAKVYMSDGNTTAAIASVREILALPFPANAPEAEDVRNDARALLARLLVGQNQLGDAMTVVREGIATASRESFFVANLYTVKGEILEAMAQAIDATDKDQAKADRHQAIEAYEQSNKIDKKLQDQLVEQK